MSRSSELFTAAQKHIPGGVNSPVRAFNGVGGDPVFFKKAKGAYVMMKIIINIQIMSVHGDQ